MRLKYLTGYEADDKFFDRPDIEQQAHVADCLGCNPNTPESWPLSLIDRVISVRRTEGEKAFHREISRLLHYP